MTTASGSDAASAGAQASVGAQTMVRPIRRLVLKHPRDAFRSRQAIEEQWRELGFLAAPDFDRAQGEYDAFVELLARHVPDIVFLPPDDRTTLDSIYVHDPVLALDDGLVLCRMGKPARRGEADACAEALDSGGMRRLGRIEAPGVLEGGDVIWIDEHTLVVGEGYRTNAAGIAQLAALAGPGVTTDAVALPHWNGPGDVLHLMSLMSLIDVDLAVVYSRLLPVRFRTWLMDRGIQLVEVPDEEFASQATNVLAVAPRVCLLIAGNPVTRRRLEEAGALVNEFDGTEICQKGCGGPTCLTRPILRR